MNELSQIYQTIANIICDSIDEDWKEATIFVRVANDIPAEFKCTFVSLKGEPKNFRWNSDLYDCFEDMYRISKEAEEVWREARFKITEEGKFDIRFEYAD